MRRNFLMIGQSNMSGRGDLAQVPTYANASRIFMYGNDDVWKLASEPIDSNTNQFDSVSDDGVSVGAGIGLAFANRICELFPNDEVGLIPAAKGSTRISQWRRFYPRDFLYGNAVNRVWDAESQGVLSGVLFWQGEGDTLDTANASGWREDFSNMCSDLRVDLQNLSLPIAFARLNNLSHPSHPYWTTVRNGQTATKMKNLVMVSTDGATYQSGNIHATTAGYVDIGIRFADAIAPML